MYMYMYIYIYIYISLRRASGTSSPPRAPSSSRAARWSRARSSRRSWRGPGRWAAATTPRINIRTMNNRKVKRQRNTKKADEELRICVYIYIYIYIYIYVGADGAAGAAGGPPLLGPPRRPRGALNQYIITIK